MARIIVREVVAAFVDPGVGATSCFYRAIAEPNLGAELEAVGAASDFFAGALIADWKEGVTFALGASVTTTKSWLKTIGGLWVACRSAGGRLRIGQPSTQSRGPCNALPRSGLDDVPSTNGEGILGASSALGKNSEALPADFVSGIVVHTRIAMGTAAH